MNRIHHKINEIRIKIYIHEQGIGKLAGFFLIYWPSMLNFAREKRDFSRNAKSKFHDS